MSIIFIDGFDAQDYALKWISTLGAAPTFGDTTAYGMGSALKASTSSGRLTKPFTAAASVIVGLRFKVDSLSSARVIASLYGDTGSVQHHLLQVSTSGQIQATRAGTILASSTAGLIVVGAWNYVEFRGTIADAAGVFEVKVNGVQVINFSGDTKNVGTNTTFDLVALGGSSTQDLSVAYDDFYILNTSGSAPQNTFLNEVVVQTLFPNAAGNSTGLTPTGSANNYENVDEIPPSALDYNASASPGAKDSYSLSNLVGSVGTIFGVQENMIASKTGVGAANMKSLVRSGGADYTQTAVALSASPQWYGAIRETDPATSAAWTSSAVNALEAGAEVA